MPPSHSGSIVSFPHNTSKTSDGGRQLQVVSSSLAMMTSSPTPVDEPTSSPIVAPKKITDAPSRSPLTPQPINWLNIENKKCKRNKRNKKCKKNKKNIFTMKNKAPNKVPDAPSHSPLTPQPIYLPTTSAMSSQNKKNIFIMKNKVTNAPSHSPLTPQPIYSPTSSAMSSRKVPLFD